MADRPHVGDTGTRIRLDCGQDVSTASVRRIRYVKPGGISGYWTAAQDGSDSQKIYFDTLTDSLDVKGAWKLYSYIEKGGWAGHGEEVAMQVYPVI